MHSGSLASRAEEDTPCQVLVRWLKHHMATTREVVANHIINPSSNSKVDMEEGISNRRLLANRPRHRSIRARMTVALAAQGVAATRHLLGKLISSNSLTGSNHHHSSSISHHSSIFSPRTPTTVEGTQGSMEMAMVNTAPRAGMVAVGMELGAMDLACGRRVRVRASRAKGIRRRVVTHSRARSERAYCCASTRARDHRHHRCGHSL